MLESTIRPLERARWIFPDKTPYVNNTYAQYRKDFQLEKLPRRAPLHITADQSYMLYVNGRYVGRGPARGYQHSWPCDSYDIAPFLQAGHNWISVRHYCGGISTFGYLYQWRSGMLCAARWRGFELLSDASWLSRTSPASRPGTRRVSIQLNLQEQVDARLDDQRWITSPRPPRWTGATTAIPYGSMPWHAVEPRGIPNLGEEHLVYAASCGAAAGDCAPGWAEDADVAAPLRAELPAANWSAATPGRRRAEGFEIKIEPTGAGRWRAVTLDLGQLAVGNTLLRATGAAGGEAVDLFYSEVLLEDRSPLLIPSMAARLTLRRGTTSHEFFHMMGHRYLTVVVRESRKAIKLRLALRQTVYPMDVAGRFDCDDPTINAIHGTCVHTQRICSLDAYVDTPWREQAQWWGDARVQAANTFHLSGDARLLARGIRSLARQEVPNGLTYGHAPTNSHACILPDFAITWVQSIYDYYRQTASLDLFVEQLERIERVLGYFHGEGRGDNGLIRYDRRYWLFLDWSTITKVETPTLLNLWFLDMLDKLVELAALAGLADKAAAWRAERRAMAALIDEKLFDARRGLYCDGLDERGRRLKDCSVHSQTAALLCGLRSKSDQQRLADALAAYLRDEPTDEPVPSCFWVHYVYAVMIARGHGREVVEHIRRHYAPMIPYGGTWEVFKWEPGRGSTSHAWSAHPIVHLAATLGGVRQATPGWTEIRFAPVLNVPGVTRCETIVPTPLGPIHSAWRRRGDATRVELKLPHAMIAAVDLPGLPPAQATGRAQWTVQTPEI